MADEVLHAQIPSAHSAEESMEDDAHAAAAAHVEEEADGAEEAEVADQEDAGADEDEAAEEEQEGNIDAVLKTTLAEIPKLQIAPGVLIIETRANAFGRFAKDTVLKKVLATAFRTHKAAVTAEITLFNRALSALKKLLANKEYSMRYNALLRARERALQKARAECTSKNAQHGLKTLRAGIAALLPLFDEHMTMVASKGVLSPAEEQAMQAVRVALNAALESTSVYAEANAGAGAGAASGESRRKRPRSATLVDATEADAAAQSEAKPDAAEAAAPQV